MLSMTYRACFRAGTEVSGGTAEIASLAGKPPTLFSHTKEIILPTAPTKGISDLARMGHIPIYMIGLPI